MSYYPGREFVNFVREQHFDPEINVCPEKRVGGPFADRDQVEKAFGHDYTIAERKNLASFAGALATGLTSAVGFASGHPEIGVGSAIATAGLLETTAHYGRVMIGQKLQGYMDNVWTSDS
ncbi:MAG TPA: hypothetical protein VK983_00930 [Candidatus Limnocylindrales bacterium]|nr:hypothetical protein [Candidatus Limnocylindrales bacterium]